MILIASDHAGFRLKRHLVAFLEARGETVRDLGVDSETSVDYPDYAHRLAAAIEAGEAARGILICGTGLGMSDRFALEEYRSLEQPGPEQRFTGEVR